MHVDIPNPCRACGANLNDRRAEYCGPACEQSMKIAPGALVDRILDAAERHGRESESAHETGDLADALTEVWNLLAVRAPDLCAEAYRKICAKISDSDAEPEWNPALYDEE